jgi:monoamine oxidase
VTGIFARELEALTDAEILEHVMKFLRQIFPGTTVPDPINFKFTRWLHDLLAYGSYSNFAVHAGLRTIEQLTKATSDGWVQWAGEHANTDDGSEDWSYGCVHSAFESGQKAAKAIQDQLCSS